MSVRATLSVAPRIVSSTTERSASAWVRSLERFLLQLQAEFIDLKLGFGDGRLGFLDGFSGECQLAIELGLLALDADLLGPAPSGLS